MTQPGAFQLTAFQSNAFQDNQALAAPLSLSGTAAASFASKLGDAPSAALAGRATVLPSVRDALSATVGSRAALQAGAFQANAFQQRGDQLSGTASLTFAPADLRKALAALPVSAALAAAGAGALQPSGVISAKGSIGLAARQAIYVPEYTAAYDRIVVFQQNAFQANAFAARTGGPAYQGSAFQQGAFQAAPAQPEPPLFDAKARFDPAPTLVRGGGGKKKRPQRPRQVEPAIDPLTFERFLKERKPTEFKDVIAADRVAPLLEGLPDVDVGWAKPRSEPVRAKAGMPTRPDDVGTRPAAALPTLHVYSLDDLEDQLDAMAALAALPDPAVIHAQRLAAEAQDLRDIAAILARL